MIFDLPETTTQEIAKTLVRIRGVGGQNTTSRVLTLIVAIDASDDLDSVITAVSEASREHPSRVIIFVSGEEGVPSKLDAEIRTGGDAGASEILIIHLQGDVAAHQARVVTPLLLPDTPVVTWWPFAAPVNPQANELGELASRRITDSLFDLPLDALYNRRAHYRDGDSDMAWARLTPWRGVLASALDQRPHEPVQAVNVYGPTNSPSVDLAAGWLACRLGVKVTRFASGPDDRTLLKDTTGAIPVTKVELLRPSGPLTLTALDDETIAVSLPGREPTRVAVTHRTTADCLAEELRHMDADDAYAGALRCLARVDFQTI